MNLRSSVAAISKTTPKINIAKAYLELQRLRQLVQQAERSHAPQDFGVTPTGSRINPRRERQA
jgi:predicted short-subunit dehydrogenase-like oxidoreductase (DUF2520 family)